MNDRFFTCVSLPSSFFDGRFIEARGSMPRSFSDSKVELYPAFRGLKLYYLKSTKAQQFCNRTFRPQPEKNLNAEILDVCRPLFCKKLILKWSLYKRSFQKLILKLSLPLLSGLNFMAKNHFVNHCAKTDGASTNMKYQKHI